MPKITTGWQTKGKELEMESKFILQCSNFACRASGSRSIEAEATSLEDALKKHPKCPKCGSPMQEKKVTRDKRH